MKNIFLILLLTIFLVGCGEDEKPLGKFDNVIVKEKITECDGCIGYAYYIVIEKDSEQLKLKIRNRDEEIFRTINKGNEISVTYDKDFAVIDITFPKMEGK